MNYCLVEVHDWETETTFYVLARKDHKLTRFMTSNMDSLIEITEEEYELFQELGIECIT